MEPHVGYVYVLVNPAIPGLVKIGMTTGDPAKRAQKLSSTGIPGKWIVYKAVYVPHCAAVERAVHQDLAAHRHSRDREFFKITANDALKAVNRRADENINLHPGWPDPVKVQDNLHKIESQKRKEAESRQLQKDQARIAEAKKREAEKAQDMEERRNRVDASTRETLKKGPIGWGTFFVCLFFGAVFSTNTALMWPVIIGIVIWGFWINRDEKKSAITLRQQWNLPAIATNSPLNPTTANLPQQFHKPLFPPNLATNNPVQKKNFTIWIIAGVFIGLFILLANTPSSHQPPQQKITTPIIPTIQKSTQENRQEQAQPQAKQMPEEIKEKEEQQQADLSRQNGEVKPIKKETQQRQATTNSQRKAEQRQAAKRRKKTSKNKPTASPVLPAQQSPQIKIETPALPVLPVQRSPQIWIPQEEKSPAIKFWKHRDGVWNKE